MSQYAPRRGQPTSSDAYSNPDIDADVDPGHRWHSRRSDASSPTSPSSPTTPISPVSPYSTSLDDSSSIGRRNYGPPLSSVGSLSHSAQRSPRRPVPSPLSTASIVASSATGTSPRDPTHSATGQRTRRERPLGGRQSAENPTARLPVRQTTFYSDSSSPSSPDEEISGLDFGHIPNDSRSATDSVTSKAGTGPKQAANVAMATSMASAPGESTKGLPRNSSIDTAISAMSLKQGAPSKGSSQDDQNIPDIASLIETAGSPEAVIQHLLKEKHSQSQQNTQLWRLVDKQRAMILGLNKDLEGALKEKEKYRKKLKELMFNPTVAKAASGHEGSGTGASATRIDVDNTKSRTIQTPDSPGLDSDSQRNSPTDIAIAPYPITPPADKPHVPSTAVSELLDPKHAMPKPQEHAVGKYDHTAEEQAADKAWKDKNEQQLREIPYNVSLPPSRSYPSEPPKVPPPKLPTAAAPPLPDTDSTPQPDKNLRQFPSPPRKGPPAPLQLKQSRNVTGSTEEDDSDSDYDDLLEVSEIADAGRGRRKTREEDDRGRGSTASKLELEEGSPSEDDTESEAQSPTPDKLSRTRDASEDLDQTGLAPSMDAVLRGDKNYIKLPPHGHAAGLPSSPHPFGNIQHSASAPLSDRMPPPTGVSGPLSPRPPRQAIPLPPNTPLASPPALATPDGSSSILSFRSLKQQHQPKGSSSEFGTERTKIYKGLVTEEYPDLLLPPNALPSIMINVASSRMKPSRASLMSLTQLEEDPVFTLAVISRADGGELWRVEKDIASLSKLDQRLKQCNAFTAKTPDRSLFSGHAPAKLDARRVALEQYLEELLDTQLDNATAVELCKYLSTHTLPPNADETGSSFRPTPENSGLKIASDGRPFRSGYLTKKGKNFGGWKARFFVLEGPQLKYYETPGGAHLGTIKLQNAQIGKQSQPQSENQSPARAANGEELDNQYRHAFLILEPKKKDSSAHVKHVLCAENDKERDLWVEALLQWIDFRDPDDTEPPQSAKSFAPERQAPGSDQPSSGRSKKPGQAKAGHQQADSDGLIGVRYDSTHAGDTPQSAPGGSKGSAGQSEHNLGGDTMSSQASKLISAPKDPQIISDSAAWGNKIGLMAPTHDEKKQRKRSFFGFGPKTRSSSDGQDSLFGGSESGSLAGPSQGSYSGPIRQVFGAPLAEAVRYNPPTDVDVPLPSVVYRCIQYLDSRNAVAEEGIFRLSGSNVVIKQLRERFNVEGDVNLVTDEQYYDIHAVASLLKLYLRELPTTILTRDLHLDFLSTTEIAERQEKVARLNELAQRLPQANATLLKYLIAFLIRIINNSDINKMNVRNVGIVFSPTLNIPAQVFAMFLQNYEGIFGIDPEEYELPSPTEETDSQGQGDAPSLRFEPPPRPSTSSGSASPHRQPRLDSRREHSRSTPTPPLMSTVQGARSTPTPPLAGPASQVAGGPSAMARPAYESGYPLPAGHEVHGYHPVQRSAPGYDRPLYQSSGEDVAGASQVVEQTPQSNSARRRESSIYMGGLVGLQHQGSKSRLREEAHF